MATWKTSPSIEVIHTLVFEFTAAFSKLVFRLQKADEGFRANDFNSSLKNNYSVTGGVQLLIMQ